MPVALSAALSKRERWQASSITRAAMILPVAAPWAPASSVDTFRSIYRTGCSARKDRTVVQDRSISRTIVRDCTRMKAKVPLCIRCSYHHHHPNTKQAKWEHRNPFKEFMRKCTACVVAGALAASICISEFPAEAFEAKAVPILSELSVLISGPPIKDPNALLRYALPIDNKPIRDLQKSLENITENLKIPGEKALDPVGRLRCSSGGLHFCSLEEAMVEKFPFDVPKECATKPLLKGRATVEMKVKVKDNPNLNEVVFQMVLDGYNAPVTAGNFIDLVERHFYDDMEIQRADGFVVQTGDPDGPAEGFVDPSTEKIRTIPLEIMVDGDEQPIYGVTLEELGRYKAKTKLPFNAFGTLAMAREEFENDSASSQIFWLLKESELTPSNANILDGRYAGICN